MPVPLLEPAAAIEYMTRLETVGCQVQLPARPLKPRITPTRRSSAGHSRAFFIQGGAVATTCHYRWPQPARSKGRGGST